MEGHSFATLKPHLEKSPEKMVTVRGVAFRLQKDGKVFAYNPATEKHSLEIYFTSPLAAEVRKASGWFK